MNIQFNRSNAMNILSAIVWLFASVSSWSAMGQTWNYRSNSMIMGGSNTFRSQGEETAPGYITLHVDASGQAILSMFAGTDLHKCFTGPLKAEVAKTDETTIITVPPLLLGCDAIRFIIKNNGTGGTREVKVGEKWIRDRFNRDLTRRN